MVCWLSGCRGSFEVWLCLLVAGCCMHLLATVLVVSAILPDVCAILMLLALHSDMCIPYASSCSRHCCA